MLDDAKDAELQELRQAVLELNALLSGQQQLFAQCAEEAGRLDALRQQEAAERQVLQAALQSQQQRWEQRLQQERERRCVCSERPLVPDSRAQPCGAC